MHPKLFILSAPSGTGKTTVANEVIARHTKIKRTVSFTTRAPRTQKGEQDGIDYHFINREAFEKKSEDQDFLESAKIYGNLYGTSEREVKEIASNGFHSLLIIDTQGGESIRIKNVSNAVFIFLVPPSISVLRERLKKRGTESDENIEIRLSSALEELKQQKYYDHVIINDNLEHAVSNFLEVIALEETKL